MRSTSNTFGVAFTSTITATDAARGNREVVGERSRRALQRATSSVAMSASNSRNYTNNFEYLQGHVGASRRPPENHRGALDDAHDFRRETRALAVLRRAGWPHPEGA